MHLLAIVLVLLILASWCYGGLAVWYSRDFFLRRAEAQPPGFLPPVSLIKPVAGCDADSLENFRSFCRQDYPEYEIVFALADPDDPVLPLLEQLRDEFPQRAIRWVVVEQNRGPNYKVGNLLGGLAEARHELLVITDADMRVRPDYLLAVVAAFAQEGVGLVTCLYRNIGIRSVPALLESLILQCSFLPNVLLARRLEGISFAFGATLCTSRAILARCGGLEELRAYLADDYQLGNRIHRLGLKVEIPRHLVDHVAGDPGFAVTFRHQLRWAITQRVCRPGGYLASGITHGLFWALLLVLLLGPIPLAVALLLATGALRIAAAAFLNATALHNRELARRFWLLPAADLLAAATWLLSLVDNRVHWQRRRFRVRRGGVMEEL